MRRRDVRSMACRCKTSARCMNCVRLVLFLEENKFRLWELGFVKDWQTLRSPVVKLYVRQRPAFTFHRTRSVLGCLQEGTLHAGEDRLNAQLTLNAPVFTGYSITER